MADDGNDGRPLSAASSYSHPGCFGLEGDGSIRTSTRSEKVSGAKNGKESRKRKIQHKFAEVGIRNVGDQIHTVYKGKTAYSKGRNCKEHYTVASTGDT